MSYEVLSYFLLNVTSVYVCKKKNIVVFCTYNSQNVNDQKVNSQIKFQSYCFLRESEEMMICVLFLCLLSLSE